MDCIEREAAIKLIEERQKALCPVGRYSRHYVYGSDLDKFDALEEIIDAIQATQTVDPTKHGGWRYYKKQGIAVCSCCSFERKLDENFGAAISCPNCGAKMDL